VGGREVGGDELGVGGVELRGAAPRRGDYVGALGEVRPHDLQADALARSGHQDAVSSEV